MSKHTSQNKRNNAQENQPVDGGVRGAAPTQPQGFVGNPTPAANAAYYAAAGGPQGMPQGATRPYAPYPQGQQPVSSAIPGGAGGPNKKGPKGSKKASASPKKPKKRPASFYISIIVALIAVIAAAGIGYAWWADQQPKHRDANGLIGQVEGKTQEEIQEELDRIIEEGMFQIAIASEVEMENGSSPAVLLIENVPNNHYLMQVTITRDDTGETLYESGILEPNYHIQEARLGTDLPAGTYDATATFHALDMETEEDVGSAAAKIKIIVKS